MVAAGINFVQAYVRGLAPSLAPELTLRVGAHRVVALPPTSTLRAARLGPPETVWCSRG